MPDELDEVGAVRLAAALALAAAKEEGAERKAAAQALAAAKEAVRELQADMFAMLGINLANFDDVKRLREDMEFIRSFHRNAQKIGGRFMFAVISALAGALAIGAWEFLRMLWMAMK